MDHAEILNHANLDVGADGIARCPWGAGTPDYLAYHDDEWGVPTTDERTLFEKLCLEGFQSGLSWLTILRKREGFRAAFDDFDAATMAAYTEADVERLVNDAAIVRHRGKIEAAINNARRLVELWDRGRTLAEVIWGHEPVSSPAPHSMNDLAPTTAESAALSKELKKLGFSFVGPTTAYAGMQAMGIVNDHLVGCASRQKCEDLRSALARP